MQDPEQDDPPDPTPMTAEEFVTGLDPYDEQTTDPPEPIEDPPEPEPEPSGLFEKLKDVGRHVFGLKYDDE